MKRTVTIILSLTLFVLAAAQTKTPIQKGIIKITNEKGSMAAKGFRIRPSHYKSPIESDNNGSFSIDMKGYKEGQSYRINSVIKIGYDYVNKNETFNNKPFSTSVPLEIFMYNTNIAQDSSLVYQKKLNARLNKKIENLEKEIKILKQDSDKNKEKIEQLQDSITFLFEKGSVAIKDLADEVAKYGDYAPSHIRKDVYEAIKNGDFEKLEELKKELSNVHTTAKTVAFNRDNIIDSLQAKLLICKAEFNYKEALTCIDDLILLDPNNIDFLFEAGNIALGHSYLFDYNKALQYFDKALNISLKYGEKNEMVVNSYNHIGDVYAQKGEYDKALTYFNKALDLGCILKNNKIISNSHYKIGRLHSSEEHYEEAILEYKKSLNSFSDPIMQIAAYEACGWVYYFLKNDSCLNMFYKAFEIEDIIHTEPTMRKFSNYLLLGSFFCEYRKYEKAILFLEKALSMNEYIMYENELDRDRDKGVALYKIAVTYEHIGNYIKTMEYLNKSLSIYNKICSNKDNRYIDIDNYTKSTIEEAIEFYKNLE